MFRLPLNAADAAYCRSWRRAEFGLALASQSSGALLDASVTFSAYVAAAAAAALLRHCWVRRFDRLSYPAFSIYFLVQAA